jgi:hypothetical protein
MKKLACILVGLMCLTGGAFGEGKLGPILSWIKSNDSNAFGGGLEYEWQFNKNLGLDVRAGYLTDSDMYVIPIEVGIIGILPLEGLSLYAGIGCGYFIPEDIGYGSIEGPDSAFGYYGVAGIRLPMAENVEFFAELNYTKAESDEETGGGYWRNSYTYVISETTKLGMDLDGIGANVGILWNL